MLKWLFAIAFVISLVLAVYCFKVSSDAQRVVDAVNGPPLFREKVDFSKAFTNEFSFRHVVRTFYGTMYLTLRAVPRPEGWSEPEDCWEDMKAAKGKMRVISSDKAVVQEGEMNWFYWYIGSVARQESNTVALQDFFGRLPVGDYRLVVSTTAGVPKLENAKQELLLRYDLIHERSIAKAGRSFGIVFVIVACAFAGALVWVVKRRVAGSV
jgi:hypothetical protein